MTLLISQFDLLATAPGGVARLRELILTLAVQGKLVPQEAGDEPASVLLQKMRQEIEGLIAARKIRRPKRLDHISSEDTPSDLPDGWTWTRLGLVGDWGAGATPSRSNSSYYGGKIPWFKSGELTADTISISEESVTELALRDCSLRLNQPGDVLIAMYGATIGKTSILNTPGTTNQAVCACTPFTGLSNTYLLLILKALKPYFISIGAGGAQPNISREKIVATPIALPPLVEQSRIVTRVEELMRLCDALEQQRQLETAQHAQLLNTLLGTLTDCTSPDELAANWQRVSDHFDLLLDRPEAVDALEQTILQLAVRGLLVPQDPGDEPASVLLQRIRAEKDRLILAGKIKREKQSSEISREDHPFVLPSNWTWVRWHDVSLKIGDIDHKMPNEVPEGIPYVSPRDFYGTNEIDFDGAKKISVADFMELSSKIKPECGDLIYPRYGTIGNVRMVNQDLDFLAFYSCAIVKSFPRFVDPEFQYLFSISECAKVQAAQATNKTTQPNVGLKSIQMFCMPLPPQAEQTRIVARVTQLRDLCTTLRQRLAAGQTTQRHLAEALVEV